MATNINFYSNQQQLIEISNKSMNRADGLVKISSYAKLIEGGVDIFDDLQEDGFEPDEILAYILQSIIREIGPIAE